jgi:hypothetical protein
MARSKPTPKPVEPDAAAGEPPVTPTIRAICERGLIARLPTAEIIAAVKAVHPTAKTTPGCVAWYRSKLAKQGLVPTGAQLAEARRQAAAVGQRDAK